MFRKLILISFASLLLASCVKEDLRECNRSVYLRYYYTKTPDGVNRFEQEVGQMRIFVFDEQQRFYEQFNILDKRMLGQDNQIVLPLPVGKWHIVSWGSGVVDRFDFDRSYQMTTLLDPLNSIFRSELVKGETTLDQFQLMVQYVDVSGDLTIKEPLCPLFYGDYKEIESKPDAMSGATVSMTKNSKVLHVKVGGITHLPAVNQARSSAQVDLSIKAFCEMRNGRYKYTNEIGDYARKIKYLQPFTLVHPDTLLADFTVLRLMKQDHTSKLVLESPVFSGGKISIDIVPAILSYYDHLIDQEELDRIDSFDFQINLATDLKVTITVNGFEITDVDADIDIL